jgi:polyhydroxybutyrate depolymerase
MGGAAPTGGKSSTGGMTTSRSNTGGAPGSGGATGKSETTGGTNASGGNTSVGTTSAAGGPTSVTCPKTALKIGDNTQTITSAGKSRTFIVRLPTGYTGSAAIPAIIDFHPLGGSGSGQEGSSGWKAKCDSVGCISVYPDSVAGDNPASWNAGYCCDGAEKNQTDDVSFARDIVKWLIANTCVDAKRIYASGGSNGGGMTYRMACEASDVIAAVAPVDFRCVTGTDPLANGGKLTASNNTACSCPRLNRPITVVAWDEGADTSIVPYAGGQTPQLTTDCPPSGSCVGIGFTSAQVNAETWASYNKCTGSPTTDPDNSLCKTWTNCEGNTTVSLCTTTSGGHLSVYGSSAKWTDMAWNKLKTQSLP